MEAKMRKNIILISGIVFLPILTYGSSRKEQISLNSLEEEPIQERGINLGNIGGIVDSAGDIATSVGNIITAVGDDGLETDNTVETVGKHISLLGAIIKLFSKLCKNVDAD